MVNQVQASRHFVAAVALAAAALAGPATAGTTVGRVYWTTAQAEQSLSQRTTLIVTAVTVDGSTMMRAGLFTPDGHTSGFYDRAQTARCLGVGAATKGLYTAFKCDVRWVYSQDINKTVLMTAVWVRPLAWRASRSFTPMTLVCASARALADCPPAIPASPLPGDPRACPTTGCSPEPSAGNLAATAEAAAEQKGREAHRLFVNFGCVATTTFAYQCNSGVSPSRQPVATVRFVQGAISWTTVVTLLH